MSETVIVMNMNHHIYNNNIVYKKISDLFRNILSISKLVKSKSDFECLLKTKALKEAWNGRLGYQDHIDEKN